MSCDFCFFTNVSSGISQYQSLSYATDVIKESLVRTVSLKGKYQLIVLRREHEIHKQVFVIYNYVYGTSLDSFGLCFVFNDKYPEDIRYIFSFCHNIISDIVKEGKVLYIDKNGNVQIGHGERSFLPAVFKRYIDRVNSSFNTNNAKLCSLSLLTSYYKISKNQYVVHELSDSRWSMTESLNYNHIVIFTEEIEQANINEYKNVVRTLKKEKSDLFNELECQKEIYSKLQKEKRNYKYIVALLILLLISSVCIFLIYENKKREEQQFAQKEKEMTDTIVSKNDAITNIQNDLSKMTMQFDSLQQAYSSLQSSYSSIESKLRKTEASKSNLENRIKNINTKVGNRQPFVVIDMAYNKSTGNLSVSYYGFNSGIFPITIKALYDNSSYNCGSHTVKVEQGFHGCSFQIGRRQSKKFVLMKGKTIIGGDLN